MAPRDTPTRLYRQRGAAFVEAIIIVSVFTLLLMGMMFFHDLYRKHIRTARLARASVIAYSMGGCDDSGGPRSWAPKDLDPSVTPNRSSANNPAPAPALSSGAPPPNAAGMLKVIPGAPTNGSTFYPMAQMALGTTASATVATGVTGPRRGFTRDVGSKSHVVCGEQMREGTIEDLINAAGAMFKSLI